MSRWATRIVLVLNVLATIAGRSVAGDASLVNQPDIPEVTPLEATLWRDLGDGTLDDHSLLQAAMIAGGCRQQTALDQGQAVVNEFCRTRAVSLARCGTASQRAELLFRGMHEALLTGPFQEHCYRLDHTLAGEAYNCLTSTILYLCLCRECGIAAVAEAGPTHVYGRLSGDLSREIQTTQADSWARSPREETGTGLWTSREREEQALPTRPSYVHELDDVGLIARVYYNRGTSLLLQNEYRRAARYLERSCQLDPSDEAARRNRITAWNAWALELCDQECFRDAVQVLADCRHFAPEDPATLQNELHIHHRWALALCQQHRFSEALRLLENGYARQPQAELYDEGRWAVIGAWASWELQQGGVSAASQVFATTRERYADASRLRDRESQFWLAHLDRLQREGRQAEAELIRHSLRSTRFRITGSPSTGSHLTGSHLTGSHLTGRDL